MPLAKPDPPLPRAQVSRPVTAQAWNQIIDSVDSLYDAAAVMGREYVQVNVTFRDGPVPLARVAAVPAPDGRPGPAVEGAPDGGDGTGFQLRGLSVGPWIVHVEAPGFAPKEQPVTVPSQVSNGAVSTIAVEMDQTHVFVPDVVGFSVDMGEIYIVWANFLNGPGTPGVGISGHRIILAQGPAPATRVPVELHGVSANSNAQVITVQAPTNADPISVPWRTLVPDFIGMPKASLARGWFNVLDTRFVMTQTIVPGATDPLRVVSQKPSAGEIVPAGTAVDVTLDHSDPQTMRFGEFAGTHRKLADQPLKTVADKLLALWNLHKAGLFQTIGNQRPWAVARWYLRATEVQAIEDLFANNLGAPIGDAPGEGLAAAWASASIGFAVMLEELPPIGA